MRVFAMLAVLILASCSSKNTAKAPPPPPPAAKQVELAGAPFVLAAMTVKGLEIPLQSGTRRPTIQFNEANRATGFAGVNRYSAEVTRTGNEGLSFGPAIATKMAGPPGAMAFESGFLDALSTLTRIDFQGGRLKLASADGSTRLEFTR